MPQFKPEVLLTHKNKYVGNNLLNGEKQPRGSSVEERWTHNPEVGGATPSPATNYDISPNIILGEN